MFREIRQVSDSGNGSAQVTVPKDTLRAWGLVSDDGSVREGHLVFERVDDGSVRLEPV
mgnify:FL=1